MPNPGFFNPNSIQGPPSRSPQLGVGLRVALTSPGKIPARGIFTPPAPDFSMPGWDHRPGCHFQPAVTQPWCPQAARSPQGAGKVPECDGQTLPAAPPAVPSAGKSTFHRHSEPVGPPRVPAGTDRAPPCPSWPWGTSEPLPAHPGPAGTSEPFPAPRASRRCRCQGHERGERGERGELGSRPPPC